MSYVRPTVYITFEFDKNYEWPRGCYIQSIANCPVIAEGLVTKKRTAKVKLSLTGETEENEDSSNRVTDRVDSTAIITSAANCPTTCMHMFKIDVHSFCTSNVET